jgi:hypothetical protein
MLDSPQTKRKGRKNQKTRERERKKERKKVLTSTSPEGASL